MLTRQQGNPPRGVFPDKPRFTHRAADLRPSLPCRGGERGVTDTHRQVGVLPRNTLAQPCTIDPSNRTTVT
eukprot:1156875-Pelagomonas_calceolata.AAC.4